MSTAKKVGIGAALVAVAGGGVVGFKFLKDAGEERNRLAENGAVYDVGDAGQVDPAAITYEQSGVIATGMKSAMAVVVDEAGRVLIAGDRQVRILGADGGVVSELELSGAPTCVAGGADGMVVVGFEKYVEIYGADGKVLKTWPKFEGDAYVTGVSVRGGEIFVADAGRRMIVRCDLDGKVLGELSKQELVLPSAFLKVIPTGDGQLLVNNPGMHRVEVWNSDGELLRHWGKFGAGLTDFIGCCNPSQLAMMADGRVIVAEKGTTPRVRVYTADGELDGVVAGPKELGRGRDGFEVAVDKAGRILVMAQGGTEIRVFELKTEISHGQPQTDTDRS